MGGCTFFNVGEGESAQEAFNKLVAEAQYDYGHAGYTGTIAEKANFIVINCPEGKDPEDYADQLIDEGDPRVDDKWGPAGCIPLKENKFLFFGWASS